MLYFFLLLSTPETMHSFIYFSCSPWHKSDRCRKQFPLGGSCTGSWPVYSVLHITGQFFCFQQMLQDTAQIYCHFLVVFLCSFWGLVSVLYSKNLKSCIRWSDLFFSELIFNVCWLHFRMVPVQIWHRSSKQNFIPKIDHYLTIGNDKLFYTKIILLHSQN